jgi:hypothetical protein
VPCEVLVDELVVLLLDELVVEALLGVAAVPGVGLKV